MPKHATLKNHENKLCSQVLFVSFFPAHMFEHHTPHGDEVHVRSTKITDEVLLKLHRDGFVVVDDALPLPVCETLRHEMDVLLEHGQMWNSQSYSHEEGALHHDIWVTWHF